MKFLNSMSLFFGWSCLSGLVVFATSNLLLLIRDLKKPTSEAETSEYLLRRELNHLRNLSWPLNDRMGADLRAHLLQQISKEKPLPVPSNPNKRLKRPSEPSTGRSLRRDAAPVSRRPPNSKRTRRGKRGGKRVRRKEKQLREATIESIFGIQVGNDLYLENEEEKPERAYRERDDLEKEES